MSLISDNCSRYKCYEVTRGYLISSSREVEVDIMDSELNYNEEFNYYFAIINDVEYEIWGRVL